MAEPAPLEMFYVTPPNGVPNPFAEFWSGFLQTRTPWAREVFSARLAALDPANQYKAIAGLQAQRARLLDIQAQNERAAQENAIKLQQSTDDMLRTLVDADSRITAAEVGARGQVQSAQIKATADREIAGVTEPETRAIADDLKASVNAAERRFANGQIDAAQLEREIQQASSVAMNAVRDLDPGQQDALSREVRNMGLLTQDPVGAASIRESLGEQFGAGRVVQPYSGGGVGAGPSRARSMLEEVYAERKAGIGPAPSVTVSTKTSTSTSSPRGGGAPAGGEVAQPATTRSAGGGTPATTSSLPSSSGVQQQLRANEDAQREIMRRQRENPFGDLGGFFDPLPGAGGRVRKPPRSMREGKPESKAESTLNRIKPQTAAISQARDNMMEGSTPRPGSGAAIAGTTPFGKPGGTYGPAAPARAPATKRPAAKPAPTIEDALPPQSEQVDTGESQQPPDTRESEQGEAKPKPGILEKGGAIGSVMEGLSNTPGGRPIAAAGRAFGNQVRAAYRDGGFMDTAMSELGQTRGGRSIAAAGRATGEAIRSSAPSAGGAASGAVGSIAAPIAGEAGAMKGAAVARLAGLAARQAAQEDTESGERVSETEEERKKRLAQK